MSDPRYKKLAEVLTGYSTELKKGDTVLMPKYGGTEIKLNGKEYQITREEDILGIVS